MIIFENLKWKNFLSTGNNFTVVNFRDHKTNLIVGQNGAGKSTMLDALSFALFGKPHRNIGKPQLVNSINNKDCLVEVNFNVSGSKIKIIRGIKPNIFEIWQNGQLLNQSSHAKEYQKILEQNILKLNHKSFHQIVVLGSSSFIPFMQLPAQHRRDVIEDLLDINVFSKMNGILKEQTSLLKDQIKDIAHEIEVNKTKIDAQKKYIRDVKAINKEQREEKLKLIDEYRDEVTDLNAKNEQLSGSVEQVLSTATEQKKDGEKKVKDLLGFKGKFETQIRKLVKDVKFFESNDICPSCSQTITEETKQEHILEGKEKARELQEALKKATAAIDGEVSAVEKADKIIEDCRKKQSEIHGNNQSITNFQNAINRTLEEINKLENNVDMDKANGDLELLIADGEKSIEQKLTMNEQYQYNIAIIEMLKDTGIKTKIIKQYIPIINRLVNQYLQILDFFVHFNLDDSFKESIRSRHRDSFSYDSFSEGEKQRIDLALLFTWRQIAKMKNSVSTNLLILDETFDSSLDYEGVDNLMKIIHELDDDTNVFVISHKGDILDGKFSNKIEFKKEKNFSKIAA